MAEIKVFPEFTYWRDAGKLYLMSEVRKLHKEKYYKKCISKMIEAECDLNSIQEFLLWGYDMILKEEPDKEFVPMEHKKGEGFSIKWRLDDNQESEFNRVNKKN